MNITTLKGEFMLSDIMQMERFFKLLAQIWFLAEGSYSNGFRKFNDFEYLETGSIKSWLTKWGIHDHSTFTSETCWLLNDGYRTEFNQLLAKVTTFPYHHNLTFETNSDNSIQENAKLRTVIQYQNCLSASGILAYDYITYIAILHMSTTCGYLTTKQTVDRSKQAIQTLQKHYQSWDECMISCIAGSKFHGSRHYDQDHSIHHKDYIEVLHTLYHSDISIHWYTTIK